MRVGGGGWGSLLASPIHESLAFSTHWSTHTKLLLIVFFCHQPGQPHVAVSAAWSQSGPQHGRTMEILCVNLIDHWILCVTFLGSVFIW